MTTKIEKALSLGKTQGARKLLEEFYLAEDKRQWLEAKQAEYDVLFKTQLVEVAEEFDEDGNIIEESYSYFDYIDDCISFTDWLNETKTVLVGTEVATDDEGVEYQKEIFEEQLIRVYTPNDVSDKVDAYISSKYVELRKNEYPPIEDYVDAVVKGDNVAIEEYKAKCLAVKAKYPKV